LSKMDSDIATVAAWHASRRKGNQMGRAQPKPVSLAAMPARWDEGAQGPANQDGMRTEPATDFDPETGKETPNPNGIKRRRRDDWATRYHRAGNLSKQQVASAARLRMASEGMREQDPLAAIRIDRRAGGSDQEAARVDARRYFRELWAHVPQSSRMVVQRVVLDDLPIWRGGSPAQRERHMVRLRAGLDALP
jgi:hypothetical protein